MQATGSASNAQEVGVELDILTEHIIVGVDIGYTYTGVAVWSTNAKFNESIEPVPIQSWPGGHTTGRGVRSKVPTLVAYRAGDLRPRSWGFECPWSGKGVTSCFKFLLDEHFLEQFNGGKSEGDQETKENVRKWFTDFLSKLHSHVVVCLKDSPWYVDWGVTKVEYIFSLPTSWEKNDDLVDYFRRIIGDAGFGSEGKSSVAIGLTEGVASAVYTAKSVDHNFNQDEILLVCDAGGGTTDICALKVAAIDRKTVKLETIQQIGIPLGSGSVQIDEAFEALFEEKLRAIRNMQPDLFKGFAVRQDAAKVVARGAFQKVKVSWGTGKATRYAKFQVPGRPVEMGEGYLDDAIDDYLPDRVRAEFLKEEIEAMFDSQINLIKTEIDGMLESLRAPELTVSNFVLAGGFGSSAYVQSKLATYCGDKKMRMLVAKEPPLSVCKGLVLDRMQRLLHGTSVLRTRRCRVSYGFLYHKSYNRTEHKDREIYTNPGDGKKYVIDQIRWFVLKGQSIEEDRVTKLPRECITSVEHAGDPWTDTIVVSKLPPANLPQYLGQNDCDIVCEISSSPIPNTLTSKRKHLGLGKKFLRGKYEIWGIEERENIRFESRVNGEKVGEGEASNVPWEYIGEDEAGAT